MTTGAPLVPTPRSYLPSAVAIVASATQRAKQLGNPRWVAAGNLLRSSLPLHCYLHAQVLTTGTLGLVAFPISPDVDVIPTDVSLEELLQNEMVKAAFDSPPTERKEPSYADGRGGIGGRVSNQATSRTFRHAATSLEQLRWELIEGPVTDCECAYCKKSAKLGRALDANDMRRIYKQQRLNRKRAGLQREKGTRRKAVVEKRVKESLANVITSSNFALEASAPVNSTGWMAKPRAPLPQQHTSLSELRQNPRMRYYAWDGK